MKRQNVWSSFLTNDDLSVAEKIGSHSASLGQRPALVVIDVMRAFFGEDPHEIDAETIDWSFSCGQNVWDALPKIRQLVEQFRNSGLPIVYARMDGPQFAPRTSSGIGTIDTSPVDPAGIMPDIAPTSQDMVITKTAPSAFFGTPLISYLTSLQADSIVLCGTSTSGCVRVTAVDAFSYNLQVSVAQDATFDRFEASHALSLFDLSTKYADVATVAEIAQAVAHLRSDLFKDYVYDRNFAATTAQPNAY